MYLIIIFICFITIDIWANPWIPEVGQYKLIESWQKNTICASRKDIGLEEEIEILSNIRNEMENNRFASQRIKEQRIGLINGEIHNLVELKKDKIFRDIWANNIYFEYGIKEKISVGFNIFSQARRFRPQKHYTHLFSNFNFINSGKHIMSGKLAIVLANDLELQAGLSYGYSWKSKQLRWFTSFEPTITFDGDTISRISFYSTNGVRINDSLIAISQSTYERNLAISNPKFKHIFREKFSLVKEFETAYGLLALEVGFFTDAYFKKYKNMEKGVLLGIWFEG